MKSLEKKGRVIKSGRWNIKNKDIGVNNLSRYSHRFFAYFYFF